jgi:hypothetical protein
MVRKTHRDIHKNLTDFVRFFILLEDPSFERIVMDDGFPFV